MNTIGRIAKLLRRTVLVALLVGLLSVSHVFTQAAYAETAPGAPENPSEKQKTLYEGKRTVVVSEGEPAKPNQSTNATYVDSQGRQVNDPKNDNKKRAEKAGDDSESVRNSRTYGRRVDQ